MSPDRALEPLSQRHRDGVVPLADLAADEFSTNIAQFCYPEVENSHEICVVSNTTQIGKLSKEIHPRDSLDDQAISK